MKLPRAAAWAAAAATLFHLATFAQPVPEFDVAYRAWDVVTDIARHNHKPDLGGTCSKTFRPFVIPGLKPQSKADQGVSAQACVTAARAVCADAGVQRTAEMAAKCSEFR